jgi:REP element-mobilizing transposase RayT
LNTPRNRRSIRLPGYDYSQIGAYFVTLVAQGRIDRFGELAAGALILTRAGEMLRDQWLALPQRFTNIELDEFVVMPNHFHGIVIIVGSPLMGTLSDMGERVGIVGKRAETSPAPTDHALGDIIGAYKSITTHEYIIGVNRFNWTPFEKRLWQRNYYEHILRDGADLDRVRAYIRANPLQWNQDREYLTHR